jgi:hypothetical protein
MTMATPSEASSTTRRSGATSSAVTASHRVELGAQARLLARRTAGKVLDAQEHDAGGQCGGHLRKACRDWRALNRV